MTLENQNQGEEQETEMIKGAPISPDEESTIERPASHDVDAEEKEMSPEEKEDVQDYRPENVLDLSADDSDV